MYRQSKSDDDTDTIEKCEKLLEKIELVKNGKLNVNITLLDPMGHSQILHEKAVPRDLTENELEHLEVGPSIPVFSSEDLD